MGDFSATDAISAGFRLIARNPLAVLWWLLAYLVIGVLPQILAYSTVFPEMIAFYQQMGRGAVEGGAGKPDMAPMMAIQGKMAMLQPIILITSLVSQAVLIGAIYRGVLQPEERRFGGVRFSASELWLGIVMAVMFIMAMIVMIGAVLVFAIAGGIAAAVSHGDVGPAGWMLALLGLVAFGVFVWAGLRLSLAMPMSFAARRFLIFESWPLTRGHALKMFGVLVAVFVIVLVIEAVVFGAAFVIGVSALAGGDWNSLLAASPDALVRQWAPWLPLWIGFVSLVGVALFAILAAPWAEIYRQLAPTTEPVVH